MFRFLFLFFLYQLLLANTFHFEDVVISITSVSTGSIFNTTAGNKCKKLIARSAQVYHVSSQSVYQSWPKNSLSTPTDTINVTPLSTNDIDVDPTQSQVDFVTTTMTSGGVAYNLNGTYHKTTTLFYNQPYPASYVASDGLYKYVLVLEAGITREADSRKNSTTSSYQSKFPSLPYLI